MWAVAHRVRVPNMPISASALMIAITAIHEKAQALKVEIDSTDDPDRYLEEEWHACLNALSELRAPYVAIQNGSDNLPTYDELTAPSVGT